MGGYILYHIINSELTFDRKTCTQSHIPSTFEYSIRPIPIAFVVVSTFFLAAMLGIRDGPSSLPQADIINHILATIALVTIFSSTMPYLWFLYQDKGKYVLQSEWISANCPCCITRLCCCFFDDDSCLCCLTEKEKQKRSVPGLNRMKSLAVDSSSKYLSGDLAMMLLIPIGSVNLGNYFIDSFNLIFRSMLRGVPSTLVHGVCLKLHLKFWDADIFAWAILGSDFSLDWCVAK